MLNKKKVLSHLLALGLLCIGFVLCRYVFFDIHGMKQWPVILFAIGIIAVAISFILEGKTTPVCTAFTYIAGFVVGVMFQTDGTDAGDTTTNNLWIIWTVVFICLILAGVIHDKFLRPSKKTIR